MFRVAIVEDQRLTAKILGSFVDAQPEMWSWLGRLSMATRAYGSAKRSGRT
jgi:hypothetical protein